MQVLFLCPPKKWKIKQKIHQNNKKDKISKLQKQGIIEFANFF